MSTVAVSLARAVTTPAITGAEAEIIGFGKLASRDELTAVGTKYPEQVLGVAEQFPRITDELPDLVAAAAEMNMLNSSFI